MVAIATLAVWSAVVLAALGLAGGVIYLTYTRGGEEEDGDEEAVRSLADSVSRPLGQAWKGLGVFIGQLTFNLSRMIPFVSTKFWHGMSIFSLHKYHTKAGGDAIGLEGSEENGKVQLTPVKWFDGAKDEEEAGWHVKGEDRVYQPSKHPSMVRLGRTPLVPLNADETRAGSLYECSVAEAVVQGRYAPIYDVSEATLSADVKIMQGGGQGQAIADGGVDAGWERLSSSFDPRGSPIFSDYLIDLGSDDPYNGQTVSLFSYATMDEAKTTPERMNQAEQRGLIAGRLGQDTKQLMVRLMLIAAGIAIGGILASHAPAIMKLLIGGGAGGGGGGGINPFTLGVPRLGVF